MRESTAWTIIFVVLFLCVVVLFLGWHIVDMVAMSHYSPATQTWASNMTYTLTIPSNWYCTLAGPVGGGLQWIVKCKEPK